MTTIRVVCTDQVLTYENTPMIASGGLEENFVQFSFCNQWDGFEKTAVFWRSETEAYHNLLDVSNSCQLPPEVTAIDGVIYLGVFGVDADGRQRTSNVLTYRIEKGAITLDTKPSEPTPDIYNQLLVRYQEMKDIAAEVKATEEAFEEAMIQQQTAHETAVAASQASFEESVTQRQTAHEEAVDADQLAFQETMTQAQEEYEQHILDMIASGLLPDDSVATAKLKDNVVTTPKIANLAVTKEKLADKSVTVEKIADGALSAENVELPAETAEVLGASNVDASLRTIYEKGISKVGDTLTTYRTDLGDNWELCDGRAIESDLSYLTLQGFGAAESKPMGGSELNLLTNTIQGLKRLPDGRYLWLTWNNHTYYPSAHLQVTEPGSLYPKNTTDYISCGIWGGCNYVNGHYVLLGGDNYYQNHNVQYGCLRYTDTLPLSTSNQKSVQFTDSRSQILVSITYDERLSQYVVSNAYGNLFFFANLSDTTRTLVEANNLPWGTNNTIYLDYINGQMYAYGGGGIYKYNYSSNSWVKILSVSAGVTQFKLHGEYFYYYSGTWYRTKDFTNVETVPESTDKGILDFYGDYIVMTSHDGILVKLREADLGGVSKSKTRNSGATQGTVLGDELITFDYPDNSYNINISKANLKKRLLPTITVADLNTYIKVSD